MRVFEVVIIPTFCWYTAGWKNKLTTKEACLAELHRLGLTSCLTVEYLESFVEKQLNLFDNYKPEDRPTGNAQPPWTAVQESMERLSALRGKMVQSREAKKIVTGKANVKKEKSQSTRQIVCLSIVCQCFLF